MKICSKCNKSKPLSEFNKHSSGKKQGHQSQCRPCSREGKRKGYHGPRRQIMDRLGISQKEFDALPKKEKRRLLLEQRTINAEQGIAPSAPARRPRRKIESRGPREVTSTQRDPKAQRDFSNQLRDTHVNCMVTGAPPEACTAAHIKPWKKCNDEGDDNFDLDNGLWLRADLHKLFDLKKPWWTISGGRVVSLHPHCDQWHGIVLGLDNEYTRWHFRRALAKHGLL